MEKPRRGMSSDVAPFGLSRLRGNRRVTPGLESILKASFLTVCAEWLKEAWQGFNEAFFDGIHSKMAYCILFSSGGRENSQNFGSTFFVVT